MFHSSSHETGRIKDTTTCSWRHVVNCYVNLIFQSHTGSAMLFYNTQIERRKRRSRKRRKEKHEGSIMKEKCFRRPHALKNIKVGNEEEIKSSSTINVTEISRKRFFSIRKSSKQGVWILETRRNKKQEQRTTSLNQHLHSRFPLEYRSNQSFCCFHSSVRFPKTFRIISSTSTGTMISLQL